MVVRSGDDGRSAGSTDRVCNVAVVEAHSFIGQSVEIWCMVYASAITTDGFGRMVIRHYEDDVGLLRRHDGGFQRF